MANLVETARSAGLFSTFLAAAEEAKVVDMLSNRGPFTVLAPTDDAFSKLPEGVVEKLMRDRRDLFALLTYHLIAGRLLFRDIQADADRASVEGRLLSIRTGDGIRVNDARVVEADIEAHNGVIHVLDAVLTPPSRRARAA
jgi:uncharacterized surface protein with fasciclin (FAS1) repeats